MFNNKRVWAKKSGRKEMKKNISKSPNPLINIEFWYIYLTDIYANVFTLLLYSLNQLPVNHVRAMNVKCSMPFQNYRIFFLTNLIVCNRKEFTNQEAPSYGFYNLDKCMLLDPFRLAFSSGQQISFRIFCICKN